MKCMNRLWVVLAVAGASLLAGGCIEEEGHREEEVPVGHVTLNGVEYRTGANPNYIWVPFDTEWSFVVGLIAEETGEVTGLVFICRDSEYYFRVGDTLRWDDCRMGFMEPEVSVTNSDIKRDFNEFLSGSIRVVSYGSYEGGFGLKFEQLRFTLKSRPDEVFELDGTIYYRREEVDYTS